VLRLNLQGDIRMFTYEYEPEPKKLTTKELAEQAIFIYEPEPEVP